VILLITIIGFLIFSFLSHVFRSEVPILIYPPLQADFKTYYAQLSYDMRLVLGSVIASGVGDTPLREIIKRSIWLSQASRKRGVAVYINNPTHVILHVHCHIVDGLLAANQHLIQTTGKLVGMYPDQQILQDCGSVQISFGSLRGRMYPHVADLMLQEVGENGDVLKRLLYRLQKKLVGFHS
jgi:hypothetical protein